MTTNADLTPTLAPAPQPGKRKQKPNAFVDHLHEWDSLLAAVREQGLEQVEAHRAALAEVLEQVRQAKNLQETHRADFQTTTQTLKRLLVETKHRAIRLRGAVRAELGPTTAKLAQFGIHPLRPRPRRSRSQSGGTE